MYNHISIYNNNISMYNIGRGQSPLSSIPRGKKGLLVLTIVFDHWF